MIVIHLLDAWIDTKICKCTKSSFSSYCNLCFSNPWEREREREREKERWKRERILEQEKENVPLCLDVRVII